MAAQPSDIRDSPAYHYSVQAPLEEFWVKFGTQGRKVLFILGHGFDPRCYPALDVVCRLFSAHSELTTFCARFTNLYDRYLADNRRYSQECLARIRHIARGLSGPRFRHFEVEVNLFSADKALVGERLLIEQFEDCLATSLESFTDILVDVSAFPRSLMYTLVAYLWERRPIGQNLFITMTELDGKVAESDFLQPSLVRGEQSIAPSGNQVWIPVLGGDVGRFQRIYDFLRPVDIFPIIPFPASDPRQGDNILLANREELFGRWGVPTSNVLYASGSVPQDVFRKICDFVVRYRNLEQTTDIVVSALSGRTLSLGALMAALRCKLALCHSQPTTYRMTAGERNRLKVLCTRAMPTLFWVDGSLYDV